VNSSFPSESKLGKLGHSSNSGTPNIEKVLIGQARLAITQKGDRKCQLCSGCLEGCPYDSIFNSGNELLRIAETNKNLQLLSGFVNEIELPSSSSGSFRIMLTNISGESSVLNSTNVYLALGVIATPTLLMRSKIISSKVSSQDSQVFYTAFFSFKRMDDKRGTSLAKLFVVNKDLDPGNFHLSLYSPNAQITKRIEQKIQELSKLKIRIPKGVSNRIVTGIGFIDPEFSGRVLIENESKEIILSKEINPATKKKVNEVVRTLARELKKIGLWKIPFASQIPEVAAGYHTGGGLLGLIDTKLPAFDEFGRLRQSRRLMVTDASAMVFDIAGPHTLTAMAHAYRNAQIN
jgi:hypothetical protein